MAKKTISFVNDPNKRCANLQERLNCALGAMRRYFPHVASWSVSPAEASLMINLPEQVSVTELLRWADSQGITFVPGFGKGEQGKKRGTIYLHFAHLHQSEIEEGIKRLGNLVIRYMDLASRTSGQVPPQYFFGP